MATFNYDHILKELLADFEKQTAGLESELSRIISQKLGNINLNPIELRAKIQDALRVATRDISLDKIGKIELTNYIDTDPSQIRNSMKKLSQNASEAIEEYLNDVNNKLSKTKIGESRKIAEDAAGNFIAAFRVALSRGINLDAPELNIDVKSLNDLQKRIIDAEVITGDTVKQINNHLASIGLNKSSDQIIGVIKSLSDEEQANLIAAARMRAGYQDIYETLDKISDKADSAGQNIRGLGEAFGSSTANTSSFATELDRVAQALEKTAQYSGNRPETVVGTGNTNSDELTRQQTNYQEALKNTAEISNEVGETIVASTNNAEAATENLVGALREVENVQKELGTKDFFGQFGLPSEALDASKFENIREVLDTIGGRFKEIDETATDFSTKRLDAEFLRDLVSQLNMSEESLQVVNASLMKLETILPGGIFANLTDDVSNAQQIDEIINHIQSIATGTYIVSEDDVSRAREILETTKQTNTGGDSSPISQMNAALGEAAERATQTGTAITESMESATAATNNFTNAQRQAVENEEYLEQLTQELSQAASKPDVSYTQRLQEADLLNEQLERRIELEREAGSQNINEAAKLSPLENEINNINGLLQTKNSLFEAEESIVAGTAQREATALGSVEQALNNNSNSSTLDLGNLTQIIEELKALSNSLNEISDKKISVNLSGLNKISEDDIASKFYAIGEALKDFPDSISNFQIKGIGSLNRLLKMDINPDELKTKFDNLRKSIKDFADAVSEIKIQDSSFVASIDNLISHGDKLADLATVIRAKQSEIDAAKNEMGMSAERQAIESEIEKERQAVDELIEEYRRLNTESASNEQLIAIETQITETERHIADLKSQLENVQSPKEKPKSKEQLVEPYREALKTQKELYDLRLKGDNLNATERQRLDNLNAVWEQLHANAAKVTQELEAQGAATTVVDKFANAYANGYKEYADSIALKKSRELSSDVSWIDDNILAKSKESKFKEDLITKAEKVKALIEDINKNPIDITNADMVAKLKEATKKVAELKDNVKDVEFKEANQKKIASLGAEIEKYLAQFSGLSQKTRSELEALREKLKTVSNPKDLENIVVEFNNIQAAARRAGEESKSFWTKVGEQINHTNAQMVSMYFSFYRVIGYIRQATQEVIKLDSALTELRKVSDASTERLAVSFNKSAQTAKELGSTIDSVINQTADWSRLGFSIEDSEKLARVTTMFQTVGDNMTTDTASQAMISTLKAYEMGVNDAEDIVDRYNEVANNFSIDTAGIAEAIEKSGASLKAAGNDLNESLGMIVAGNASLQNPNTVGTMLKTFSMRLRGATKSELDELGIDTTGMTDAKKSVVKQFKAMAGIDIMEGTNYKSTFQILDELHDKWEDLTDVERAALTEAVGGKRGGTVMSSLMTNWEDARAAVETAQRGMAENSGLRELENASQSIQFSLNQLKAAWQELSYDVLSSDFIKGAVDVLTKVVEGIDNVNDATHGLIPTIIALGVAFSVISTFTGWTVKPIIAAFKALKGAKLADTLANIKDTASEVLLGKAKEQTARASREATLAQEDETAAQLIDNYNNIGGGLTEAAAAAGEVAAASGEAAVSGARLGGVIGFLASPVGIAIAALAALAATITAVHNSNENLKQSARELSDSYSSTTQDIDKFKDEISDLQEKINDSSTSYDDAKSARERLLGIQDELIEKYGTESSKIQLVTEAINGQVDALDKLSEKEWQQTKNEFNKKSGLGVGDWLNKTWRNVKNGVLPWDDQNEGFIKDKIGIMNDVMNNANVHLNYGNSVDIEFISRMRKILGDDFLTGKLEKVRDNLLEIQKYAKEADISVALQNSITNEINKANDDLTSYQSMAKQVLYNDTIVQNYSSQLKEMEDAYDKYEDAIVKKNDELAAEAKDSMLDVIQGLEASNADEEVIKYFREMKPDLKKELGQMEFKADVQATIDTSEAEDAIQNVANPVGMPVIPELESDSVELEVPESPTTIPITPVLTDENGNKIASLHDFYDKQLDKNAQPVTLDVQAQSSNSQSDTSLSEQTEEFILSAEELNKAIGEFNNEEQLADFEKELESATQEQLDAYGYLAKAAEQYGRLKVADLLPLLREMGMLGGIKRTGDDQFIANVMKFRGKVDYGKGIAGLKLQEQDQANMQSAMNKLSDKDREDLFSMGTERQSILADEINKAVKANDGRILSEKEILDILNEQIEKFQEMKAAAEEVHSPEFNLDTFNDAANKIKNLQAIWAKFDEQREEGSKIPVIDASEFSALDDEIKSLSGFNEVAKLMSSGTASAEEQEAALNSLATEYVYTSGVLTGLNEENREFYIHQLELKGITNASQIVTEGLAEAYSLAAKNGIDLSNATEEDIIRLSQEEGASELASYAIKELAYQKLQAALVSFDESSNIEQLRQLAQAAGLAASSISVLNSLGSSTAKLKELQDSGADRSLIHAQEVLVNRQKQQAIDQAEKDWDKITSSVKLGKIPGGGAGGKKGGGGGGGSKKEKEEEVDVLKELSAQLDEIQAAYASLTEITEKYNETGKLTVDQAQELINTDFHFLAMLKEENGQLKLNEQGMQDLAKAKITEMQIQLARNAIDTVNKLQTEADAINFLKYAYEGLAGATLDATEAQLKMAVAAAKARGEAQGSAEMVKAAESIYQGYLATKQAIGNTDFSKESLKGDQKDKTKETKDKDKDKEEKEETKTRFNWLEQLVNNIQRTIDRLAKRAEKYFSYMEKNAMVDKQIAANRRMINTQEVASTYYSSKAGKALKKVPKKYRKLVSGDFDAATVKKLYADVGEKGTEKLNTYLDWKTLRDESQDKLADAYDRERELIASKMDNILSYFDTLIGYQQNIVSGIEASMKLDTAKGLKTDINKIIATYGEEKDIVEKSAEREEAYRQEAASNTEAIRNSYNSQIDQTQTGYQNTTDYQKLKNKGKQGKAKSTIQGGYEVLEEDITEAIAAAKKLNSKKSSKQAEGRAVLERLHQKYVDRITELQREADEVEKANQEKLADQIEQNKTMTKEAEIAKWERMKSVLEEMGKVYDSQISQLGTLIDKYETLADLLKSVDASTIAKYNVNDIFGLTGDEDSDRKSFIQKSIDSTKSMIEEYKKQYALYGDIVNAMESSAADRQQKFLDILKKNNLDESSKKIVEDLAKELAGNNWEGNEYLEQYKQMMSEIVSSIAKSIKQIEDYSDELADSVTEATQKIIDALKLLQDAYASKASLINDSWVVDINGITKFGYAKVSALSQEMNIARQRADQFRQQITDIENAGANTYGSQDEYDEARNTAIKNYYEALQNAYSVQNEIYEIAKKAAQVEIDNVSKLVENYKKALNSKKAYYDYDKTLREKNKNIQALEAEMKALENVGDAASKARLKAIQAELKEAQEDLDDTVFEHSIQVETDALDKLIEDMTNALDNSAKTIQETFEEFARTVSAILSASSGVSSDAVYNDLIGFIMNGKTTGVISGSVGSVSKATSNPSTVAKDMKDGTLTSLNEKSLSNINTNVLNILNKQKELTALQSKISSANNSLPNIANQVTKISTNVETIARNTTSMAKGIEALNQSNQQLQALIPMMQRPGEWNEIFDQLKRRGIIRYYY